MTLYFSPGACSLAVHIALRELDREFKLEKVDLKTKLYSGGEYLKVNNKGSVPAVSLDDGTLLTEGAVILRYFAEQAAPGALAPAAGTPEFWRCQEWLHFVATDLHKGFSPLFNAGQLVTNAEGLSELRENLKASLAKKFALVAAQLDQRPYLLGASFTVVDAYLFTVLRWARAFKIELAPTFEAYFERVRARPAVAAALTAEGLRG